MIAWKKFIWLFLLIAGLLACLGSPAVLLAQEAKVDLYLRILPEYYYKEVIPGEDNSLFMEIRNNGDEEITDIVFEADKPEGWGVEFQPGRIEYLGAGSSQTIDVKVTPAHDTSTGEYSLTFVAEAKETRTATGTILRVENGSLFWTWVGIGIGVLVAIGFVFVFLHFDKQGKETGHTTSG